MITVLESARRKLAKRPHPCGFLTDELTYEENQALRVEERRPELERLRAMETERDRIAADIETVRNKTAAAEADMSGASAEIHRLAAQAALGDESAAAALKAAEARRNEAAAEAERLKPALETVLGRSRKCAGEIATQRTLVGSLTNGIDKEPDGPSGLFWRPAA